MPLSRINAQTTDLLAIRVGLRLPAAIRPQPSGVNLDVIAKVSGQPDQKTTFFLIESKDAGDLVNLPPASDGAATAYVFKLSPDDAARFEAIRSFVFAQRQAGRSASIGMGVATKEFCRVGPLPPGAIPVSTYLLTSETRIYVTVTENLDLRRELSTAEEISRVGAC